MSYKFPAWCQMETALDDYEQGRGADLRAKAKKLGPDGEQRLQQVNQASDALMKGAQELTGVDIVETLRDVSIGEKNDLPFRGLLDEHVCIKFGWEVMEMLSTARDRFNKLVLVIQANRNPSTHAKAFLRRVARCYLFGFDSECVVMCRAVLDSEFKVAIQKSNINKWWKTTDKGKKGKCTPENLCARIKTASYLERIDADTASKADNVRKDGNDGVHKTPSSAKALDCIWKTVCVIDALASNSVK